MESAKKSRPQASYLNLKCEIMETLGYWMMKWRSMRGNYVHVCKKERETERKKILERGKEGLCTRMHIRDSGRKKGAANPIYRHCCTFAYIHARTHVHWYWPELGGIVNQSWHIHSLARAIDRLMEAEREQMWPWMHYCAGTVCAVWNETRRSESYFCG